MTPGKRGSEDGRSRTDILQSGSISRILDMRCQPMKWSPPVTSTDESLGPSMSSDQRRNFEVLEIVGGSSRC